MWRKDFEPGESAISETHPSGKATGRGKFAQSYPQLSVDNFNVQIFLNG
jgi:hypothetical protein